MKVSIIGGGGLVGSCTAFALQTGKIVREIALLDVNADLVAGQALDLLHGVELMADQVITLRRLRANSLQRRDLHHGRPAAQAGRKPAGPGQSQRRSVHRHPGRNRTRRAIKQDAIVLVVSNPVDVLTYLAAVRLDLPPAR